MNKLRNRWRGALAPKLL